MPIPSFCELTLCLVCLQMVVDPSNLRPVMTCIITGLALLILFFLATRLRLKDEADKRRRLFTKSGAFSGHIPLPDVPKDVSRLSVVGRIRRR